MAERAHVGAPAMIHEIGLLYAPLQATGSVLTGGARIC